MAEAAHELERLGEPVEDPKVWVRKEMLFVDETEPRRHFGLVGAGGVPPWEDEQIRRELVEVLKFEEADNTVEHWDVVEATDDELFPIFAECGMKPDDFVDETAERYAEYLERK